MKRTLRRARRQAGVALLMVISAIAILALVLVEFSATSRTHLNAGVNIRDDMRANTLGDTALTLTRACMDPKAWASFGAMQAQVDLKRLCDLMMGIFVRSRVDLPVGGLSVELSDIQGLGLSKGDVEELELTPEESFIGLAGLYCPGRGSALVNCGSRKRTVAQLRALFCDPSIASAFEKEQADGHRYTRGEVIGNLIDWIDPDDNRIYVDPATWVLSEGSGEGEDSYLRDNGDRYRSKDGAFDSIEELRLVRGINDELYEFMADKVSVHASGQINPNNASAEVIAALMRNHSALAQQIEQSACGEDVESTADFIADQEINAYARLVVQARENKRLCSFNLLGKTFKNGQAFQQLAQAPLQSLLCTSGLLGGEPDAGLILARSLGMPPEAGPAALKWLETFAQRWQINWNNVGKDVTTNTSLFRLRVRGRVGNMTRSIYAVLKKDGQTIRTLYYREE